jgi:hypothetical protein
MYDYGHTFHRFDLALRYYKTASYPRILTGDGYDCDCDEDGYFSCSDGLTEEQRDQLL